MESGDELLKPAEVAAMFGVHGKTIQRWSESGALPAIRTLGGHRRYRRSDVMRLMNEQRPPDAVRR